MDVSRGRCIFLKSDEAEDGRHLPDAPLDEEEQASNEGYYEPLLQKPTGERMRCCHEYHDRVRLQMSGWLVGCAPILYTAMRSAEKMGEFR